MSDSGVGNRVELYGFLSGAFLEEPTRDLLLAIRNDASVAQALGIAADDSKEDADLAGLLDELCVEYTRLFLGPGKHISPYASVWLDKQKTLWGETTSNVKGFIESCGVSYGDSWHGLPDHVGAVLEFMGKLVEAEERARADADDEAEALCLKCQAEFFGKYVSSWLPAWCKKILEETDSKYFFGLASLTAEFLEREEERLGKWQRNSGGEPA